MFVSTGNWFTPDSANVIFDFHLPGYPVVPGAITAGFIHQVYCAQLQDAGAVVDILFQQPIMKDTMFELSMGANAFEFIDSQGKTLVRLLPTTCVEKPNIQTLSKVNKITSRIVRPSELLFHQALVCNENIAECVIHYDNIVMTRPYLSTFKYEHYFILLETMGNLAMELCVRHPQEVFLFHSFKGMWFDWPQLTGELTVTTSAKRINSRIIKWSSQIKNKSEVLVGYVHTGLNVLSST